jgi:hypothetical protein
MWHLFRDNVADRDMHFALGEGSGASISRGSRLVSTFCRKVCDHLVHDPFDPHAGAKIGSIFSVPQVAPWGYSPMSFRDR